MRYLFLRENVFFMLWSTLDSIFQNHIGHLMIITQNISLLLGVSALTIVIRVRVDFHCRVIVIG